MIEEKIIFKHIHHIICITYQQVLKLQQIGELYEVMNDAYS